MTMINRSSPKEPPTTALTDIEMELLDRLIHDKTTQHNHSDLSPPTL
jgi:hypothetical protein